jgi:hypothetical protein
MDELILGWPATAAVREVLQALEPPIELESLVLATCSRCRGVVWIGPRQAALRVATLAVRVLCVGCVITLAPTWVPPTPEPTA